MTDLTLYGPPLDEVDYIGSLTLGSFLLEACSRNPDNEALVIYDPLRGGERVSWSYRELEQQAMRVAKYRCKW